MAQVANLDESVLASKIRSKNKSAMMSDTEAIAEELDDIL